MRHPYLYRLRVSYPEGSHRTESWFGEDVLVPVDGWAPPGWRPTPEYMAQFGTDGFIWPKANQIWRARSSAKRRAELLESYGATVVVERSSRITWPDRSAS